MTRVLLDANVVLRFLRDDVPDASARAKALFAEAAAGRCVLVICNVVLAECVWVLKSYYQVDRVAIAEVLSKLLSMPGIKATEPARMIDSLRRFGASNVDYTDAYLAALAAEIGDPVASFDRDLETFPEIEVWNAGP